MASSGEDGMSNWPTRVKPREEEHPLHSMLLLRL
jgi:hypothetical protein